MIVDIVPQAQQDVDRAARYYRHQRERLDEVFLAEVERVTALLAANPYQFAEVRPGVRCCMLNRFRYGIYFRMPDDDTIRIIVVRHHNRRPGFGMGRK